MHKNLCAGRLLAAFAIAIGLSIYGQTPAAATTLTVGKAAPNSDPIIPVNVGDKIGIFKKHGLDLKIVNFTGGSKISQAMAAGSIDIGDGAGTEMALIAKGVPMLAVCETAGSVPQCRRAVGFAYSIDRAAQRQKVGVSTAGSLTSWLAKELARKQGWGPDGVTPVTIGNGAASIIAAFREHLVDALGDLAFPRHGREQDGPYSVSGDAIFGPARRRHALCVEAPDRHRPNAVGAFIAGWMETIDFMRTHKAETVKIESGITGFSESMTSKEYDLTIGMFTKDCKFDAESLATLKRSFVDLKILSTPPDMSKLYTEAFLPK